MALTDADVYPSDGSGGRWRAFPLRYLARMLDIIHLSYYQDFYEHQKLYTRKSTTSDGSPAVLGNPDSSLDMNYKYYI